MSSIPSWWHCGGSQRYLRAKSGGALSDKCSVSYGKRRKYHLQEWINLNTYNETDLLAAVEINVRWVLARQPRIGFNTRTKDSQRKAMTTAALCLVTTTPCHTVDAYERPDMTDKTFKRCIPIVSVLNTAFSCLFLVKRAPHSIGATPPWKPNVRQNGTSLSLLNYIILTTESLSLVDLGKEEEAWEMLRRYVLWRNLNLVPASFEFPSLTPIACLPYTTGNTCIHYNQPLAVPL